MRPIFTFSLACLAGLLALALGTPVLAAGAEQAPSTPAPLADAKVPAPIPADATPASAAVQAARPPSTLPAGPLVALGVIAGVSGLVLVLPTRRR